MALFCCSQVSLVGGLAGRSCVGSAPRIEFLGGISISPIYRLDIADFAGPRAQIDSISTTYRRYIEGISTIFSHMNILLCTNNALMSWCQGAREAHALRAGTHNAVYNKLGEPDLMQHHGSLRDHRHGHAKGPWGARGRPPVTKRWPWASSRPIPVQHRVMCCILAQGTMEWHQVGSWGPSFVSPNPLEAQVGRWNQADTY